MAEPDLQLHLLPKLIPTLQGQGLAGSLPGAQANSHRHCQQVWAHPSMQGEDSHTAGIGLQIPKVSSLHHHSGRAHCLGQPIPCPPSSGAEPFPNPPNLTQPSATDGHSVAQEELMRSVMPTVGHFMGQFRVEQRISPRREVRSRSIQPHLGRL